MKISPVPVNAALKIPTVFLSLLEEQLWGFFRFAMNAHKPFFLCGYSFQNGLGFQRGQSSLGSGFQRRRSCLGGRHPMEGSALRGRKNPMKPAVSWHTILLTRSSVLYLWRPWVAERGCSGQEQALSVSHRTGGFCVPPGAESGICFQQNPPVRV